MPGLLRGIARTAVVAGTASHVAGNVQHRQQKKWAAQDDAQAQPSQPAQGYGEQMPAGSSSDVTDAQLDQLQKLGDLKANGILTQAEFETKKQQILSQ